MIRDRFEIRGTNLKTGRRKKVYVSALTTEEAIDEAKYKGLSDPFEVTRFPPDPPTEAQLSYATDLGAIIPEDATKEDLRAIISKKLDGGGDPQPELKEFAANRGIIFSRCIGKLELYDIIFDDLPERDRIAFFIFCVYRWVSDDRRANMDLHNYSRVFYSFADKVQGNERFLNSMYSNHRGRDLRFFGKIISDNGWETYGGSVSSIAYREAGNYLSEQLGISVSRKTINFSKKNNPNKPSARKHDFLGSSEMEQSPEGCGCVFAIVVAAIVLWFFFW